jgi:hypothetical protein
MAEPIVRSFVIDTTQAEQNLQRLDVVTTATNASLDGLYNQLISLDAQLQKLDPNSQAFAEVNTQIQQLETTITGIETGKIEDIGKAIESIDAGTAAQSIEQVGNAVEQVVAPVNNLANATDQLNAELKETKVDTSSIEQAGSDFQELAVEQEQVTTSSKSLKAQLRELQAQLAATDPDSAKYRELSQAAGELKDRIQDAAQAVGTQAGGAFERVSGSLGLVTSRIANLDFEGAAEGAKLLAQNITQIKPGDIAKGIQGIGSAFASIGKALLTNPIFLIGAAIAAAIVYADELLSLIDGVTDAETKALDAQKERAALAKEQVDLISSQEQQLKLQGKTEKEITALKLQALDTAILEQQAVVETTRIQAEGQIKAAERNAKYLQTFLDFVTFPQRKLAEFFQNFVNGSIEVLNKLGLGIEKIDVTGVFDDINNFVVKSVFDPAAERKNQEQIVKDAEKSLNQLNEQRAGIINSQNAKEIANAKKTADERLKIEQDLNKQILDARRKVFEESQKLNEAIRKDAAKPIETKDVKIVGNVGIEITDEETKAIEEKLAKEKALIRDAEEQRISFMEEGTEKEIALADLKFARLRDAAGADAELRKQIAQQNEDAVVEIVRKAEEEKRLEQLETIDKGLEWAKKGLDGISALNDIFFSAKSARVKKGSKEEEALAKKQFKFQKALQLGAATIDAAKSITASLAASPVAFGPVPNPAGIASLALATTTGAATIAKIAATKFEGGGGGGVDTPSPSIGGGGDTGSQPAQFNPLASSFLQDRPEQLTPRAYVLSGDVASQQEVRTKVEDLARIG